MKPYVVAEKTLMVEDWISLASRIRIAWRLDDKKWDTEAVQLYYERLWHLPAKAVADAVDALIDEGARLMPSVADIRKRAVASLPVVQCSCAEHIGAWRGCLAGHPAGWVERRETEEQAAGILRMNPQVDPAGYPGEMGVALTYMSLSDWYDANSKAGRPIDDPGDEHGCITKGRNAGCLLERI